MNAENTIVYVKISGRTRDGFVDPPKFKWDLEKDKKLWSKVSRFGNQKKTIDWVRLSRDFETPEYFLRKRSYRLFAKHLKMLEQEIETKTRGLTAGSEIEDTDSANNNEEFEDNDGGEDDEFLASEGLKNLRSSKILNQKVPGDARAAESSLSELSNLSVSKSALEEALLDRLQL
ncbi:LANO_0H16204g1_1 [Lachancea nothofagi CBS 11611]|uniref:Autophagy-related protein 29 n=1 Tax=Lachancea nothofagi CBS 11611 TaxID=1266666 RepID=A0A1G4KMQ1_9SACH|nr:LANO_0H16204g1_1 [Lachancea nothofagi CBS 11611]